MKKEDRRITKRKKLTLEEYEREREKFLSVDEQRKRVGKSVKVVESIIKERMEAGKTKTSIRGLDKYTQVEYDYFVALIRLIQSLEVNGQKIKSAEWYGDKGELEITW